MPATRLLHLTAWTLLAGYCTEALRANEAQESSAAAVPPVLFVQTEYLPYVPAAADQMPYRLGRELMRQAVLMAARDELGWSTRDDTLQEVVPAGSRAVSLRVTERARTNGKWELQFQQPDSGKVVWQKAYDYPVHGGQMYGAIVPILEADTRTALLQGLQKAGVTGTKPAVRNPTPPGPEIEALLNQVDIVAQFGAVRAAHAAIARDGESLEWLGVLVRGYAHLALLTEHYWYSAPEVFTARAWLYAQRMVKVAPTSELAWWHRAYAWTLGGALQHAWADLLAAEKLRKPDAPANLPAWTRLIRPYCQADRQALEQVGKEAVDCRAWSLRLQFEIAVCYGEARWMWDLAQRIDQVCPTAYGTYRHLVERGEALMLSRYGAGWGPIRFAQYVPWNLSQLADLPAAVQSLVAGSTKPQVSRDNRFLEDDAPEPFSPLPMQAAERLRNESAKAGGDPSWSALAAMLEEEQFILVNTYFKDAFNATQRSMSDDIRRLMPLVQRHRYSALINSYQYQGPDQAAQLVKGLAPVTVRDPRRNMLPLYIRLWPIPGPSGEGLGVEYYNQSHRNFTIQGMCEFIWKFGADKRQLSVELYAMLANELREVAPQWDCSLIKRIEWAKDPSLEELQEMEGKIKESPLALTYLAIRYQQLEDAEGALRCGERSLAASPSVTATKLVASTHLMRGDSDKWEQTLLKFLETPDLGLQHGSVEMELATINSTLGQWRKAKPYAVAYGQTYAEEGLQLAYDVTEGLAEWEESEQWAQAMSTSYPSNAALHWYFWCVRNGRGDLAAAKQLADDWMSQFRQQNRDGAITEAVYHLVSGNADRAMQAYQVALAYRPSFTCAFSIAHLAREAGNDRLRMETLNTMQKAYAEITEEETAEEASVSAAALAILQLMKTGDASPERLGKTEQLICKTDQISRSVLAYYLGKELDALGKQEEAEKYWRRSLTMPCGNMYSATMAGRELAKRHGTSRPDDDELDASDLWPLPADKATEAKPAPKSAPKTTPEKK